MPHCTSLCSPRHPGVPCWLLSQGRPLPALDELDIALSSPPSPGHPAVSRHASPLNRVKINRDAEPGRVRAPLLPGRLTRRVTPHPRCPGSGGRSGHWMLGGGGVRLLVVRHKSGSRWPVIAAVGIAAAALGVLIAVWRSPHRNALATYGAFAVAMVALALGWIARAWRAGTGSPNRGSEDAA